MYRDELSQIAQTVWESVLQLQLVSPSAPPPGSDPTALTAAISFTGAWNGHVTMTLGESLSRRIAGSMLEVEPEQLEKEDVLDALREVINMLGGNIKALLPPPCQLSLPFVIAAGGGELSFERGPITETLQFECERLAIEIDFCAGPAPASSRFKQPMAGVLGAGLGVNGSDPELTLVAGVGAVRREN